MKTRRGYTLIELLVVVAIIAIATAIAWPALRSPWGRSRIEEAGHIVRIVLARARVEAIESATPYQFRFQPGTGICEYGPAVLESSDSGGTSQGTEATVSAFNPDSTDSDDQEPEDFIVEETLPEGVRFIEPGFDELEIAGSVQLENAVVDPSEFDSTEEAEWSEPIIFYPNGRSMSARLHLVAVDGRMVEVVLRGLTGTAKVGKSVLKKSADDDDADTVKDDANEPVDEPSIETRQTRSTRE